MDRILEAHYAQPHRTAALQKEKAELLRKGRDTHESRSVRGTQAKHAKPLEKNRGEGEMREKAGEKSGRER